MHRIVISGLVHKKIYSFYTNVAKKYSNTYSIELMRTNIADAYDSIKMIECGLMRRKPSLKAWKHFHMATSKDGRWNFAYRIKGNTIYVEDACHSQNIHETGILSEAGAQYGNPVL